MWKNNVQQDRPQMTVWRMRMACRIPNATNTHSEHVTLIAFPPQKQTLHQIRDNTYLLTYSMVQSPSWEANLFAASQEIPRISRKPKVHYRTHKRPPPVSILGQPNPVHIPTFHLLEIHPNIIHPSTPRSPHQDLITPSPHPYAPHAQPISFSNKRQ